MELTLIRHLATHWNDEGILQGRVDIPLRTLSLDELNEVSKNKTLLAQKTYDVVFVSSLIRTHQTAELYGFHNYAIEPLVNELNFGTWEGKPKKEMQDALGSAWIKNPRLLILGEPLLSLEARILCFLKKYKRQNNVLCFTHGAVTRAILSICEHRDISKMNTYKVPNNYIKTVQL